MENYDDVLSQLQAAGLLIERLEIGKRGRYMVQDGGREKRGWTYLHEMRLDDGGSLIVGSYGVWRGSDAGAQRIELSRRKLSTDQRDSIRARIAADRKRAEAEAKRRTARAAQRADAAWAKCQGEGASDYLRRKQVAAHGLRYSPRGALVIPMLDVSGRIHGLQIIRDAAARKSGRLEKEFWPAGLGVTGHFHMLGMVGPVVLVAEGYATAASLYEATGLPVAVAFNAHNLQPVAVALRKRHKRAHILICADDDATQKCRHCRERVWLPDGPDCPHCGKPHEAGNAGISAASSAALAVGGAWVAPRFGRPDQHRQNWLDKGRKLNDFNDLHVSEGLHLVRSQIEARLDELQWRAQPSAVAARPQQGGGDGAQRLKPIESVDELLNRFSLVYGHGGTVFDHQERMLLALSDMRDACLSREIHRAWQDHPGRKLVKIENIGFDPTESDPDVLCNLWNGWPTTPRAGECSTLLELLYHMCKGDSQADALYDWVIKWLAYPIQHPGAKMKTTLVIHGPQGTGKNLFFEAIMAIYGQYGRVIDQTAIEDKFNDWASRKLFLIADEVLARADIYHVKNRLKSFITGEWIRINPKGRPAHDERNHVNMVFLSNEAMPVVLEQDDRRHAVIWTPGKLDPGFYRSILAEIADGGIAALHHHLLTVDLADFDPGTLPPMTDAKRELQDLSMDSPSQFIRAMEAGDIEGFPGRSMALPLLSPATSNDLFELYEVWCARTGQRRLAQPRFVSELKRKHNATFDRKRYAGGAGISVKGPATIAFLPGGHEPPVGESETDWLGHRIDIFRKALSEYKSGESRR